MQLEFTSGDLMMILSVKQGRKQKGLCFVSSEESSASSGVYRLTYGEKDILVDIRPSKQVPKNSLVADERIFRILECSEDSEISLDFQCSDVTLCSELSLSISSTKGLDNHKIAEAISKRVNDLQDDFDGLVLKVGQILVIERLGIRFKVISLTPTDDDCSAARISWDKLDEIHLEPVEPLQLYNICCVVEIGAAGQISDIENSTTCDTCESIPRYEAAISAISILAKNYTGYGTGTQFCGFAYSDNVTQYQMFDSQSGKLVSVSSLHSQSLLIAFTEWLRSIITDHKGKPSNPGEALKAAIEAASHFDDANDYPTLLLFCSSGVHSAGQNPVKVVKNTLKSSKLVILSVNLGLDRNFDIMDEIARTSNGCVIPVQESNDVNKITDLLHDLLSLGSDA